MTCGVYEFWCGPYFYQGSSVDMEYRLRKHLEALKRGSHNNDKMQKTFNKYGMQDERFLVECAKNLRIQYEQDYIDANWGDPHYLNLDPLAQCGGGMLGKSHSEETKAKFRALRHSDETKAKISAARKGRKPPPLTDEAKAKISAASKGRVKSPATLAKMRAANLGKKNSDEAKAKMSSAKKGRPWSEARRAAHEAKKATISPAWPEP